MNLLVIDFCFSRSLLFLCIKYYTLELGRRVMSVKNHPDYKEEKERLDYTIKYIQKTLDATDTYKKLYKDTIKGAMSDLYDLDNNLGYTEILLNTEFIMAAEKNYYNYKKAKEKPYFARVDFKIKDEDKIRSEERRVGKEC